MFLLAVPLIIGAQIIARPLMILVAGQNFQAAGGVLKILILAIGFIFVGCLLAHAVIALDKQKKVIVAYAFTAVTALAGYLIFIPLYSYYGAAWVTVYSELAIAVFSLFVVIKYSHFKLKFNVLFKSILASLAMALLTFLLLGKLNLIILVCLAALIYFIFLYMLRGITKQDLKNLIN
jgi:O-antigen/teichoic acid export membrane protein